MNLLVADGANVATPAGSAVETTMKTYTLLANTIGPSDQLLIDYFFKTSTTGGAGKPTVRLYLGTVTFTDALLSANLAGHSRLRYLKRNSLATLYWANEVFDIGPAAELGVLNSPGGYQDTFGFLTGVDMTVDQTIKLTMQPTTPAPTDVINVRGWFVRKASVT